jgi:hypothetical protein
VLPAGCGLYFLRMRCSNSLEVPLELLVKAFDTQENFIFVHDKLAATLLLDPV